jgi:hypothetical protein
VYRFKTQWNYIRFFCTKLDPQPSKYTQPTDQKSAPTVVSSGGGGGTFHRLGQLACSNSVLTSEIVNILRHSGRTPWTGEWSVIYLHETAHHRHTPMSQAGLETTTHPVFEQAKTICALDCMATGVSQYEKLHQKHKAEQYDKEEVV